MKRMKGLVAGLVLSVCSAGAVFAAEDTVLVEGGAYVMGAIRKGKSADEPPVPSVRVSSFYMSRYETTQKDFSELMGFNPSNFKGDNLPVEMVTWYDAVAYCNARSRKEGFGEVYTLKEIFKNAGGNIISAAVWADKGANGYRLPTEAEWEYAAKGGKNSKGYAYAGSNSAGSVGWYKNNSGKKTHAVGTKKANELGIFDLSGNVYEWCLDWASEDGSSSRANASTPSLGAYGSARGGSWDMDADSLQTHIPLSVKLDYGDNFIGFRLVRTR